MLGSLPGKRALELGPEGWVHNVQVEKEKGVVKGSGRCKGVDCERASSQRPVKQ